MALGVVGLAAVLLLGLVLVVAVVVAVPSLRSDRPPAALPPGRTTWRAAHRTGPPGTTLVVVERVAVDDASRPALETRVLAELDDRDPSYDQAFLEAMAAARERAALLRSEDDGWPSSS